MYLDVHQSFLQTPLIQLVSPPPVYQQDVPRLVFVPMYNVLNFDWLMQQEMQIWKFQKNYTLQITSQSKLEMGKETREEQQQFLIMFYDLHSDPHFSHLYKMIGSIKTSITN